MADTTYNIDWDVEGNKFYETGVNRGVLYVKDESAEDETKAYAPAVAWSGLSTVTESPSGAEASAVYADNIKYLNLYSTEEFSATVEAYTYPDAFAECDGSGSLATGVSIGQQDRKTFGLCYTTKIGTDDNSNKGYKIHIIYGCKAAPSEKAYASVNDSPEAITFSWEISTTPVKVDTDVFTATVVIDSTKVDATKLEEFKKIIYGTESTPGYLPLPAEIKTFFTTTQAAG